ISWLARFIDRKFYITSSKIAGNIGDVFGEPRSEEDKSRKYIKDEGISEDDKEIVERFIKDWAGKDEDNETRLRMITDLIDNKTAGQRYRFILAAYLYTNDSGLEADIARLINRCNDKRSDNDWNSLIRYLLIDTRRSKYGYMNRSWIVEKLIRIWNLSKPDEVDKDVIGSLLDYPHKGVRKGLKEKFPEITAKHRKKKRPLWQYFIIGITGITLILSLYMNFRLFRFRSRQTGMQYTIEQKTLRENIPFYDNLKIKDLNIINEVIPVFFHNLRDIPPARILKIVNILKLSTDINSTPILEVLLKNVWKMTGERDKLIDAILDAMEYRGEDAISLIRSYIHDNTDNMHTDITYKHIVSRSKDRIIKKRRTLSAEKESEDELLVKDIVMILISMKHVNEELSLHAYNALRRIMEAKPSYDLIISALAHVMGDGKLFEGFAAYLVGEKYEVSLELQKSVFYLLKDDYEAQKMVFDIYKAKYNAVDEEGKQNIEKILRVIFSRESNIRIKGARDVPNVRSVHPELVGDICAFLEKKKFANWMKLIGNLMLIDDIYAKRQAFGFLKNYGEKGRHILARMILADKENIQVFSQYYWIDNFSSGAGTVVFYKTMEDRYDHKLSKEALELFEKDLDNFEYFPDEYKRNLLIVLENYKDAHKESAYKALEMLERIGGYDQMAWYLGRADKYVTVKAFSMLKKHGDQARQAIAKVFVAQDTQREILYKNADLGGIIIEKRWIYLKHDVTYKLRQNKQLFSMIIRFMSKTDLKKNPGVLEGLLALTRIKYGLYLESARVILKTLQEQGYIYEITYLINNDIPGAQHEAFKVLKERSSSISSIKTGMIERILAYENELETNSADPLSGVRVPSFQQLKNTENSSIILDIIEESDRYTPEDVKVMAYLNAYNMQTPDITPRIKDMILNIRKKASKQETLNAISAVASIELRMDIAPFIYEGDDITEVLSFFLLLDDLDIQEAARAAIMKRGIIAETFEFSRDAWRANDYFIRSILEVQKDSGYESKAFINMRDRMGLPVYELCEERIKKKSFRYIILNDYRMMLLFEKSKDTEVSKRASEILQVYKDNVEEARLLTLLDRMKKIKEWDWIDDKILEIFENSKYEEISKKAKGLRGKISKRSSSISQPYVKAAITGAVTTLLLSAAESSQAFSGEFAEDIIKGITQYAGAGSLWYSLIVTGIIALILAMVSGRIPFISQARKFIDRKFYITSSKIAGNIGDVFGEPLKDKDRKITYVYNISLNRDETEQVKAFLDDWKTKENNKKKDLEEKIRKLKDLLNPKSAYVPGVSNSVDPLGYQKLIAVYIYTNDASIEREIRNILKKNKNFSQIVRYVLLPERLKDYSYLNSPWIIEKLLNVWHVSNPDKADKIVAASLLDHSSKKVRDSVREKFPELIRHAKTKKRSLWQYLIIGFTGITLILSVYANLRLFLIKSMHAGMQYTIEQKTLRQNIPFYDNLKIKDLNIINEVIPVFFHNLRDIPPARILKIVNILKFSTDINSTPILEVLLKNVWKMPGEKDKLIDAILDAMEYRGEDAISLIRSYIHDNTDNMHTDIMYKHIVSRSKDRIIKKRRTLSAEKESEDELLIKDIVMILISMKHVNEDLSLHAYNALRRIMEAKPSYDLIISALAHVMGDGKLFEGFAAHLVGEKYEVSLELQKSVFYLLKDDCEAQKMVFDIYKAKYNALDEEGKQNIEKILRVIFSRESNIRIKGAKDVLNVRSVNPGLVGDICRFLEKEEFAGRVELIGNFMLIEDIRAKRVVFGYLKNYGEKGRHVLARMLLADKENIQIFAKHYWLKAYASHEYTDNPITHTYYVIDEEYDYGLSMAALEFFAKDLDKFESMSPKFKSDLLEILKNYQYAHKDAAFKALGMLEIIGGYDEMAWFLGSADPYVISRAFILLKNYGDRARLAMAKSLLIQEKKRTIEYKRALQLGTTVLNKETANIQYEITQELRKYKTLFGSIIKFMCDTDLEKNAGILEGVLALPRIQFGLEIEPARIILNKLNEQGLFEAMTYLLHNDKYKAQDEVLQVLKDNSSRITYIKSSMIRRILDLSEILVSKTMEGDRVESFSRSDIFLSLKFPSLAAKILDIIETSGRYAPEDIKVMGYLNADNVHYSDIDVRIREMMSDIDEKMSEDDMLEAIRLLASIRFDMEILPFKYEARDITQALSFFLMVDNLKVQNAARDAIMKRGIITDEDKLSDHFAHANHFFLSRTVNDNRQNGYTSKYFTNIRDKMGMAVYGFYEERIDKDAFAGVTLNEYRFLILFSDSEDPEVRKISPRILKIYEEKVPRETLVKLLERMGELKGWDRVDRKILNLLEDSQYEDVSKKAEEIRKKITGKTSYLSSPYVKAAIAGPVLTSIISFAEASHAFSGEFADELIQVNSQYSGAGSLWYSLILTGLLAIIVVRSMIRTSFTSWLGEFIDRKFYITSSKIAGNIEDVFGEPRPKDDNSRTYIKDEGISEDDKAVIEKFLKNWAGKDLNDKTRLKMLSDLTDNKTVRQRYRFTLAAYLYTNDPALETDIAGLISKTNDRSPENNWNVLIRYLLIEARRNKYSYMNRSRIVKKLLGIWDLPEPSAADESVIKSLLYHPNSAVSNMARHKFPGISERYKREKRPAWHWLVMIMSGMSLILSLYLNYRFARVYSGYKDMQQDVTVGRLIDVIPDYYTRQWSNPKIREEVLPLFYMNIRDIPYEELEKAVAVLAGTNDSNSTLLLHILFNNVWRMSSDRAAVLKLIISALKERNKEFLTVFKDHIKLYADNERTAGTFKEIIDTAARVAADSDTGRYVERDRLDAMLIIFNAMEHVSQDVRQYAYITILGFLQNKQTEDYVKEALINLEGNYRILSGFGLYLTSVKDPGTLGTQTQVLYMVSGDYDSQKLIIDGYMNKYEDEPERVMNAFRYFFSSDAGIDFRGSVKVPKVRLVNPGLVGYILSFIAGTRIADAPCITANFLLIENKHVRNHIIEALEFYGDAGREALMDIMLTDEDLRMSFTSCWANTMNLMINEKYDRDIALNILEFINETPDDIHKKSRRYKKKLVSLNTLFRKAHAEAALKAVKVLETIGELEAVAWFLENREYIKKEKIYIQDKAFSLLKKHNYTGRLALADVILTDRKDWYNKSMLGHTLISQVLANRYLTMAVLEFLSEADLEKQTLNSNAVFPFAEALAAFATIPGGLYRDYALLIMNILQTKGHDHLVAEFLHNQNEDVQAEALNRLEKMGITGKRYMVDSILRLKGYDLAAGFNANSSIVQRWPAYENIRNKFGHKVIDIIENTGEWNSRDIVAAAILYTTVDPELRKRIKSILTTLDKKTSLENIKQAVIMLAEEKEVFSVPQMEEKAEITAALSFFLLIKDHGIRKVTLESLLERAEISAHLRDVIFEVIQRVIYDLNADDHSSAEFTSLRDEFGMQMLKLMDMLIEDNKDDKYWRPEEFQILLLLKKSNNPDVSEESERLLNKIDKTQDEDKIHALFINVKDTDEKTVLDVELLHYLTKSRYEDIRNKAKTEILINVLGKIEKAIDEELDEKDLLILDYLKSSNDEEIRIKVNSLLKYLKMNHIKWISGAFFKRSSIIGITAALLFGAIPDAHAGNIVADILDTMTTSTSAGSVFYSISVTILLALVILGLWKGTHIYSWFQMLSDSGSDRIIRWIRDNPEDLFADPSLPGKKDYTEEGYMDLNVSDLQLVKDYVNDFGDNNLTREDIKKLIKSSDRLKYHKTIAVYLSSKDEGIEEEVYTHLVKRNTAGSGSSWNALIRYMLLPMRRRRFKYLNSPWVITKLIKVWDLRDPLWQDIYIAETLFKHPSIYVKKLLKEKLGKKTDKFKAMPSGLQVLRRIAIAGFAVMFISALYINFHVIINSQKNIDLQYKIIKLRLQQVIPGYTDTFIRDEDIVKEVLPHFTGNWREISKKDLKKIAKILKRSQEPIALSILDLLLSGSDHMKYFDNEVAAIIADALRSKGAASLSIYKEYVRRYLDDADIYGNYLHIIDSCKRIVRGNFSDEHKTQAISIIFYTLKSQNSDLRQYALNNIDFIVGLKGVHFSIADAFAENAMHSDIMEIFGIHAARNYDRYSAGFQENILYALRKKPFKQLNIYSTYFDMYKKADVPGKKYISDILRVLVSHGAVIGLSGRIKDKMINAINPLIAGEIARLLKESSMPEKIEITGKLLVIPDKSAKDSVLFYMKDYGKDALYDISWNILVDIETRAFFLQDYIRTQKYKHYDPDLSGKLLDYVEEMISQVYGEETPSTVSSSTKLYKSSIVRLLAAFKDAQADLACRALEHLYSLGKLDSIVEFLISRHSSVRQRALYLLYLSGDNGRYALATKIFSDEKETVIEIVQKKLDSRTYVHSFSMIAFGYRDSADVIRFMADTDLKNKPDILNAMLLLAWIPGGLDSRISRVIIEVLDEQDLIKEISYLFYNIDIKSQEDVLDHLLGKGIYTKKFIVDRILELAKKAGSKYAEFSEADIDQRPLCFINIYSYHAHKIIDIIEKADEWTPEDITVLAILNATPMEGVRERIRDIIASLPNKAEAGKLEKAMDYMTDDPAKYQIIQLDEQETYIDVFTYFLASGNDRAVKKSAELIMKLAGRFGTKYVNDRITERIIGDRLLAGYNVYNVTMLRDDYGHYILDFIEHIVMNYHHKDIKLDHLRLLAYLGMSEVGGIKKRSERLFEKIASGYHKKDVIEHILGGIGSTYHKKNIKEDLKILRFYEKSADGDIKKEVSRIFRHVERNVFRGLSRNITKGVTAAVSALSVLFVSAADAHAFSWSFIEDFRQGMALSTVSASFGFFLAVSFVLLVIFLDRIAGAPLFTWLKEKLDKLFNTTSRSIAANLDKVFGAVYDGAGKKLVSFERADIDEDSIKLVKDFLDKWNDRKKKDSEKISELRDLLEGKQEMLSHPSVMSAYLYTQDSRLEDEIVMLLKKKGVISGDRYWNVLVRNVLIEERRSSFKYLDRPWIIKKLLRVWNLINPDDHDRKVLRSLASHSNKTVRRAVAEKAGTEYLEVSRMKRTSGHML
ncbi:hypothetical protein ACFLTD_00525, partial [Elusimicrobiota bacterium]